MSRTLIRPRKVARKLPSNRARAHDRVLDRRIRMRKRIRLLRRRMRVRRRRAKGARRKGRQATRRTLRSLTKNSKTQVSMTT